MSPDFETFWSLYPRRVSKKDACAAWNKLTPEQKFAAVESLPIHVRYWQIAGTDKEFMPYPATWLRGERWSDELEMPIPKAGADWWATKQGIEEKARAVGCWPARANEGWHELKARVFAKLKEVA